MSSDPATDSVGGQSATGGLSAAQRVTLVLCAAGFSFDLMEIALGSVLGAVMSAPPYKVGSTELALLLASVYLGAIVGAPLLGWIADRKGRRSVLAGSLLLLGVSSIFAGLSQDWWSLALWRTVSGLALGAYPPMVIAYLTEILPPKRRGMLIMIVAAVAGLGPIAAVFATRSMGAVAPLGMEAWRWAIVVAAAGALAIGVLLLALRGPQERGAAATSSGTSTRALIRPLLTLGPLNFLSPWSTVAFPLLIGVVLSARGFALPDALLFVGLSTMGPFLGGLLASLVMDRIPHRILLGASIIIMLGSLAGFVLADSHVLVGASVLGFNIVAAIYVPTLSIYGALMVAPDRRAALTGAAWSLNRLAAVAAPLLLVPVLGAAGAIGVGSVIAVSLLVSLAVVWLARPTQHNSIVQKAQDSSIPSETSPSQ